MPDANCGLVETIKEHCRMCYTCVRECPAKAIRITEGQAEVLGERCIACGNCVRVCSQAAKQVRSGIAEVAALLDGDATVAVCLAPSFAAEFGETEYPTLVGMLRAIGFELVTEVAFGADLVAAEYRRLLESQPNRRFIATSCPAVVSYVERYHPNLVPALAPIVSPMIAQARALRKAHGDALKIVFVGPCIAKKGEAVTSEVADEIDATLTFAELRNLFLQRDIEARTATASEFDPPFAGTGVLFPIARGMLQTANIRENLLTDEVIAASGHHEFTEVIKEFEGGHLEARLLEVLCCEGCIMGAGMTTTAPLFRRRARVTEYARLRMATVTDEDRAANAETYANIDLARTFSERDVRLPAPSPEQVRAVLERMGKHCPEDELNCGACGYATCLEHAIAICEGLAESEMCLPFTIDQLRETCEKLEVSNTELANTREALIHTEKLASMGQLAAGIAHEVNNPLGTVLMLSNLLLEEAAGESEQREDLAMIASEANRCKKIVANLLQFARQNKVDARPTDVRELADHVRKTVQTPDAITIDIATHGDVLAEVDGDQIIQVLTNLANNAINAMGAEGRLTIDIDGEAADALVLRVSDTGAGIPADKVNKIFEPFFTTKKAGKGTGLGLAVTYGIVKMHRGDIQVTSNADPAAGPTGTTFAITLPRRRVST